MMLFDEGSPPAITDERLWTLWLSPLWLPAVGASLDVGLLEGLRAVPSTPAEIAERMSLDPRGTRIVMHLLASLELLVVRGGRFHLTCLGRNYLDRNSPYFIGSLLDMMSGLDDRRRRALLNNLQYKSDAEQKRSTDAWKEARIDARMAEILGRIMHAHSLPAAHGLARGFDFRPLKRLLDVGGGCGTLSSVIARSYPHLSCTIFELPPVCEVAQAFLARQHALDSITICSGDMFRGEWPKGHDCVLLSNILHDWDLESCRILLAKSYEVLPTGGRILVHEMLVNDDGSGPLEATSFAVLMMLTTRGFQFTYDELFQLLRQTGFDEVTFTPTHSLYAVVSGVKR